MKKTIVEFIDDIDGTRIENGQGGTVTFALEGASYEIDLTAKNKKELLARLEPYIAKARKVGGSTRRSQGTAGSDAARIRAWAKENGHAVPDRGRIPLSIQDAYKAAQ